MLSREQSTVLELLAALYLEQGQCEKGWVLLNALAGRTPDDAAILSALAYACLRTHRFSQALAAIDDFLHAAHPLQPSQAPALLIRAKALWGLERSDEARASLRQYLALAAETT